MQEPQPLGRHLGVEKIDAGHIAARPGEAGDKTKLDRVFGDTEDDRDRPIGCRSRSRLAVTSVLKKLMPVTLPPGRARLATRPSLTGSSGTPKTTGIVRSDAGAAAAWPSPRC